MDLMYVHGHVYNFIITLHVARGLCVALPFYYIYIYIYFWLHVTHLCLQKIFFSEASLSTFV